MNKKINFFVYVLLFVFILSITFLNSCKKENDTNGNNNDNPNNPPTASFTINPSSGLVTTNFLFDASASSDNESLVTELKVRWDWENDGTWDTEYSTVKTANHQYSDEGTYVVVLEVIDVPGLTKTTTKTLNVFGSGADTLIILTGTESAITQTTANCLGEIAVLGSLEVLQHGHCWSIFANPDINDTKTNLGPTATIGEFTSNLTGLIESLTYNVRAYATNTEGTFYGDEINFQTVSSGNGNPCAGTPTVTDADGNVYNTVQINNFCWMRENLKIGTKINSIENQTDNGTVEKYCYDNNELYCDIFGGLYQWDEMMKYVSNEDNQGICPDGWHLPTFTEFEELKNFASLGDYAYSLVSMGAASGSTNETGFSALMAGYLSYIPHEFTDMNISTSFWTTKKYFTGDARFDFFLDNTSLVGFGTPVKAIGNSVRCVKNTE
jgi:uncharacterized protein (TIGR02145 family)